MQQINEVSIFDERNIIRQNWPSLREFTIWLKNNNFRMLAQGRFSAVYGKPGFNRVIKVCKGNYDRAWLRYANTCMRTTSNPYLLDVKWVLYFEKIDMFIALIERLQPLNATIIKKLNIEDAAGLCKIFMMDVGYGPLSRAVITSFLKVMTKGSFITSLNKHYQEKINTTYLEYARLPIIVNAYFSQHTSQLYNTYNKLKSSAGRFSTDLHFANIMYRSGDNKPVITDPFWEC